MAEIESPDADQRFIFTPAEFEGSYEAAEPQQAYFDMATNPEVVVRPDRGTPVLTRMADIVQLARHPAARSTTPADPGHGNSMAMMGAVRPLIPLHLDGPEHTKFR